MISSIYLVHFPITYIRITNHIKNVSLSVILISTTEHDPVFLGLSI